MQSEKLNILFGKRKKSDVRKRADFDGISRVEGAGRLRRPRATFPPPPRGLSNVELGAFPRKYLIQSEFRARANYHGALEPLSFFLYRSFVFYLALYFSCRLRLFYLRYFNGFSTCSTFKSHSTPFLAFGLSNLSKCEFSAQFFVHHAIDTTAENAFLLTELRVER